MASTLAPARRITFTSVEEVEAALRQMGVDSDMRQRAPGPFRAERTSLQAESATLHVGSYNRAFSVHLPPPTGETGLLFGRSRAGRFLASGERVGDDALLVIPAGTNVDIVAPDLTASEAITIPEARFHESIDAICPTWNRPEEPTVVLGSAAKLGALRTELLDVLSAPEEERLSRLVGETIAWLGEASPRSCRFVMPADKQQIARGVHAYLLQHYAEMVRMGEVCRELGVGLRTLQRCFREYFQISPFGYLKLLRHDQAHRELLAGHPATHRVADVATRHGFTHLGRFAVEFRKLFGELPRETLKRRPTLSIAMPTRLAARTACSASA